MKTTKYLIGIICVLGILVPIVLKFWPAADKDIAVVIQAPIEATLSAGQTPVKINGMLSLHLEKLKGGTVKVRGFNLVFSDVPQEVISGRSTETKYASLSIPMQAPDNIQLDLDLASKKVSGTIPVQAHFPQIDEIFPPDSDEKREKDYSNSQTQQGNLKISIDASPLLDAAFDPEKINLTKMLSSSAQIDINPLTIGEKTIPG